MNEDDEDDEDDEDEDHDPEDFEFLENEIEDENEMEWESEAREVVEHALANAEFDDIRQSVTFVSTVDSRFHVECVSIDEVIEYLEIIYNEQWYANVPFEDGEAVFDSDAAGTVSDIVQGSEVQEFFDLISVPEDSELIFSSRELIKPKITSAPLLGSFDDFDHEMAEYFAKNPAKLREIDSRDFEKLMAAVFRNQGFDVQLTPRTKDGGLDLMLLKNDVLGDAMILVECKRYAANKPVGVNFVRSLYGVLEQKKATKAIIVTTSHFTSGAIRWRNDSKYRLTLKEFKDVVDYLRDWKKK